MTHSDVEMLKERQAVNEVSDSAPEEAEETEAEGKVSEARKLSIDEVVDEKGVPIKNRLAESDRKFRQLTSKIDQLLENLANQSIAKVHNTGQLPDDGANTNSYYLDDADDVKKYIDQRFAEQSKREIEQARTKSIQAAQKQFPELLIDSENHDPEFLRRAEDYMRGMNVADPEAPMKAVRLAALDLGKIDELVKKKVLTDEARRERMIQEGAAESKGSVKAEKEPNLKEDALKRLLGVDPKKVKARLKKFKEKYS